MPVRQRTLLRRDAKIDIENIFRFDLRTARRALIEEAFGADDAAASYVVILQNHKTAKAGISHEIVDRHYAARTEYYFGDVVTLNAVGLHLCQRIRIDHMLDGFD